MKFDEFIFGKCAIIDWYQYKKMNINSFILDEELQVEQLEKALFEIRKHDEKSMIYVSTYPIEKIKNGFRIYSDMLWIKTNLSCIQLEQFFSNYREIEPSAIFELNEEEKSYAELYIDTEFQHKDFESVSDLFKLDEVKVVYWD